MQSKPLTPISILLAFLFLAACKKDGADLARTHTYTDYFEDCQGVLSQNEPVIEELKNNSYPLTESILNLEDAELKAMGDYLSNAYFVGLGEATHGTREFFQMKSRIFKYLVENHGFRVMGFEATWGGTLQVNEYVLNGTGSARAAIGRMKFWTWDTEEVLELVEWMRQYNVENADSPPLLFLGFDMQHVDEEYGWIHDYLSEHDPMLKFDIIQLIKPFVDLASISFTTYSKVNPAEQDGYREDIEKAQSLFAENEAQLVASSSQREYDLAKHAFEILLQFEAMQASGRGEGRDYYMARNSEWIRDYVGPGTKVALWAHNGHISKGQLLLQGGQLDFAHGDNYKAVGFSFAKGSFQAVRPGLGLNTNNVLEEVNCLTTNNMLQNVDDNFYFIFDELKGPASTEYFQQRQNFFMLGALWDPENPNRFISRTVLPEHYDVLIHLNETTHAKPL
ncbi:MAG: erythromycin esterase family protein [Bacteroidota bacterium]